MSERCGKCGRDDGQHDWQDEDCLLPHHRKHVYRADGLLCCNGCVDRLRDWLSEIVELYATLPALLDVAAADTGEYQAAKKQDEAPAPCRLEVLSLLNPGRINAEYRAYSKDGTTWWVEAGYLGNNLPNIPATVGALADRLYEHLYWPVKAPHGVADGAAFLAANLPTVARWSHLDTLDAELGWVHRTLRHVHGITRPRLSLDQQERYPALLCPTLVGERICDGPLVPDPKERLQVKCARCRRIFKGGPELKRLGRMIGGAA